jgi:hypothetical protein
MGAAPASAANNDGKPNSDEVVLYRDNNFKGPKLDERAFIECYSSRTFLKSSTTLANNVSSVRNFDKVNGVVFFTECGFTGASLQLEPAKKGLDRVAKLSRLGLNDRLNSHFFFEP